MGDRAELHAKCPRDHAYWNAIQPASVLRHLAEDAEDFQARAEAAQNVLVDLHAYVSHLYFDVQHAVKVLYTAHHPFCHYQSDWQEGNGEQTSIESAERWPQSNKFDTLEEWHSELITCMDSAKLFVSRSEIASASCADCHKRFTSALEDLVVAKQAAADNKARIAHLCRTCGVQNWRDLPPREDSVRKWFDITWKEQIDQIPFTGKPVGYRGRPSHAFCHLCKMSLPLPRFFDRRRCARCVRARVHSIARKVAAMDVRDARQRTRQDIQRAVSAKRRAIQDLHHLSRQQWMLSLLNCRRAVQCVRFVVPRFVDLARVLLDGAKKITRHNVGGMREYFETVICETLPAVRAFANWDSNYDKRLRTLVPGYQWSEHVRSPRMPVFFKPAWVDGHPWGWHNRPGASRNHYF